MTISGVFWSGESGHVGSPAERGKIPPARFKPDLPDGHDKQAREHDGDERRGVVPQHHPPVESGGVVVHQIEQGVFAERREGPPHKVPDGIPIDRRKLRSPDPEALQRIEGRGATVKAKSTKALKPRPTQHGQNQDRVFPVHGTSGPVPKRPQKRDQLAPFHRSVSLPSAPPPGGCSEPSRRDK